MPGNSSERPTAASVDDPSLLSIGDLAAASGISPDTLRAWERRYGKPVPVRLPSGHRRYEASQVPWIRRVAEALSRGHRTAAVVGATEAELDAMLVSGRDTPPGDGAVEALLDRVRGFQGEELMRALAADWKRFGPREFLRLRVAPLLESVGRRWADGELEIRHEHFLADILDGLLRALRAALKQPARGPVVVLATLEGEAHGLGLRMAAIHATLAGARPLVLGTSTPNDEIAAAVRESRAVAVAISVSLAGGGVETDRRLADLRSLLPADVRLAAGGGGMRGPRRGPRGVETLPDFAALEAWLAELEPAH